MADRALIDADMPAHECGHLKEETGEYEEDGVTPIKRLISWTKCRKVADGLFQSLLFRSQCGTFEAYVSGGKNFRHNIATIADYKGHRAGADRGHADRVKDYFLTRFNAIECIDYEADDAMAMRMWAHWDKLMHKHDGDELKVANDMDIVIVTRDKDLDNVPGWHFKWKIGRGEEDPKPYYITFIVAIRNFYRQMLVGDTADNIPGLYGVGPKSSWVKQLEDMTTEEEMHAHVFEKYEKHYRNYAAPFFKEVGNLLHMWRRPRDKWLPLWERDDDYWNI